MFEGKGCVRVQGHIAGNELKDCRDGRRRLKSTPELETVNK